MRRKDLEIKDIAVIIEIIDNCTVLHLGINDTPAPYIVPVNFGYTAGGGQITFYFHTALAESRKTLLLAQNPNVCFEMECNVELIKNEHTCGCTTSYACVMGTGKAELITDTEAKREALNCLMFCNGFKGKPEYPEKTLERTAVYKIIVNEYTAKIRPPR